MLVSARSKRALYESTTSAELDGEGIGEKTSDSRAKNEANFGTLAAIGRSNHGSNSLEILKCIVYGGLIQLITSLSVVSSAAASDATTSTSLNLNEKKLYIFKSSPYVADKARVL